MSAVEIKAKICRWQKRNKVNGTPLAAKNMPPMPGYKAQQWGTGAINSGGAGRKSRMRNFNRKP